VAHIGVFPQQIEGRWFVRGVLEGGPADRAGLLVGDELISVEKEPYSPIHSFLGTAGQTLTMKIRRRPELVLAIDLQPVRESLYGAMQRAIKKSIRIMDDGHLQFAYLHGWTLLGDREEYRELAKLQPFVDGLVLDYRDGFGGHPSGPLAFLLGRKDPWGKRLRPTWVKPVVILTADGTRSAKEIVVHAVQKADRAVLIGEPTPGDVTSIGAVRQVGSDGLLMLPGQVLELEGHSTKPDILMPRNIRYAAGADPQLKVALAVLVDLLRSAEKEDVVQPNSR